MKFSTAIALVSLGTSVSASVNIISSSQCWRKCARKVGVDCSWADVVCNCKAVNAGLYAAANQCYCNTCDDDSTRIAVDWTSVQLNTFSAVCAVAFNPINRQAIDTAVEAASCKASGKYPENDEDSEPEDKYDSHESMPTKWIGAKSIVVPIASTASRSVQYSYATLTVPVTPVPVEPHETSATTTTTTVSSSSSSNGKGASSTKSAKSTSGNGTKNAAEDIKPMGVEISAFALAIAAIFGMA